MRKREVDRGVEVRETAMGSGRVCGFWKERDRVE
jgi:hypothetical protein